MATVLFISDSFINENLGIMCLSSYLKANGHDAQLALISEYSKIDRLLEFIKMTKPILIAFSAMTAQVPVFLSVSKIIKENTDSKIIWGGPHCIYMPNDVLESGYVDIVCVGEGEESLLILMNRLSERKNYNDIPSLWIKNDSEWIKNDISCLENNLDKYPFPDRELYYSKYPLLRNFALKRFITQRGCPYDCSYCFEPALKTLYKGKGRLVRRHSSDYMIAEIKETINRYPTKSIHFSDDTFNLDKDWVMEFLPKYRKNINLPFTCNILVQIIDEETIKVMKYSGCSGVVFGLEYGVESIRNRILNKKISDEKYIEASRLLQKYKLKFITNMMFCLPNETVDDAIKSVRFNNSLRPYGVKSGILKIYKGTKLAEFIVKNNMHETLGEFVCKPKDIYNSHNNIKNMMWACYLFLKFPLLTRFAKTVLSSPISGFLKPFILFSYWQDIRFFNIPLQQALKYFWRSRKIFIEGIGKEQTDTCKKIENR